jgi:surface antigen
MPQQPNLTAHRCVQATQALRAARALPVLLAAPLLAACVSTAQPVPQAPPLSGPPPVSGWLAGPLGADLGEAGRERAAAAEVQAAETGRRTSWRSTNGHFGVVEPGPESTGPNGPCRSFAHAIYLDGRAQRGGGTACRRADGLWTVSEVR